VDPKIISPLVYSLSTRFTYIIFDLAHDNEIAESESLRLSDFIVIPGRTAKYIKKELTHYGTLMSMGQSIIAAYRESGELNIPSEKTIQIPDIALEDGNEIGSIFRNADETVSGCGKITITRDLVNLSTRGFISLYYAGLIPLLAEKLSSQTIIYAHSFGLALITALFCNGAGKYKDTARSLFREEKIEALIEYSYPGNILFKNDPVKKWASQISGLRNMENISHELCCSLADEDGSRKMFGNGMMRDCIAGSLIPSSLCDGILINGKKYYGGDPYNGSFFYRHPLGRTSCYRIIYNGGLTDNRRIGSAEKTGFGLAQDENAEKWIYDDNIIIDVNHKRYSIKKILTETAEKWEAVIPSKDPRERHEN
jgi:hypothetical protein